MTPSGFRTKPIVIGMAGAGRACELHANALHRVSAIPIRLKTVYARRREQLDEAQRRFGFEYTTTDFEALLADDEIDVIDICTPPYLHQEQILKALKSDKHIICEKPFTGYFGDPKHPEELCGRESKMVMYHKLKDDVAVLKQAVQGSDRLFMYAENFVYAPAVAKVAEIITARRNRILFLRGEESLKGSSSPVAGLWSKTGGGTFMRTGTHPLAAALYLKSVEASARGVNIEPVSLIADMGTVTATLSEHEHRHIAARPVDVEDNGTLVLEFSDKSKAVILATDTCLGGSLNYVDVYCNDARFNCLLTLNNALSTYLLDQDGMDQVYLSEMLPSALGWNQPFISDEMTRGYIDEMQDFMECVQQGRQPRSDLNLACSTALITYAAYASAEAGRRLYLKED